jgi:catechol 2,3-dioxygenase-like lactoylglutathione lyase family enzyme
MWRISLRWQSRGGLLKAVNGYLFIIMDKKMKIDKIDHLVLTVRDIDASCAFYTRILGMHEISFGQGRRAVAFGDQKINFHQVGEELEPKALRPTPGSGDLCFTTGRSMEKIMAHLRICGAEIIEGPVRRTGAGGSMTSVYIRDPDQNLIEVATYQK